MTDTQARHGQVFDTTTGRWVDPEPVDVEQLDLLAQPEDDDD